MKLKDLHSGIFIKRYKRFFVDVQLDTGTIITAHCPNTGRMTSCLGPGWPVKVSYNPSKTRKLSWTLQLTYNGTCWIGVNTWLANALVQEGLEDGVLKEAFPCERSIEKEVKVASNTRLDFCVRTKEMSWYMEVKSVTYLSESGYIEFPDAITTRGAKHLETLIDLKKRGHGAVMLYVINRCDGKAFRPAETIDSHYTALLRKAAQTGVLIWAYKTNFEHDEVVLGRPVSIQLT